MKKILKPYYPAILISLILGLIAPIIHVYYSIIGWPEPIYITHGLLAFRPAADLMDFAFSALIFVFFGTVVQIIFVLSTKKRKEYLFAGAAVLALQILLILASLFLMISATS